MSSDHSSDLGGAPGDLAETWEDWEDDEAGTVKSLFSDATFPTVEEALAFDAATHGCDLNQYRQKVRGIPSLMLIPDSDG